MKSFLILILLSTPALAQSSQESEAPALGPPHICSVYYPPTAVRLHLQGITTLAFQVTSSGVVTNVTVKKSSGHPVLDDASVKCVQQWQYNPTTNNGVPNETKQINIVWRLDNQSSLLVMIEGAAKDCIRRAQPSDEALAKAAHATIALIKFHEGRAAGVSIEASSGTGDLDELVVQCLQNLPPEIALHAPEGLGFSIPFLWHVEPPPAPAPPSAETPR